MDCHNNWLSEKLRQKQFYPKSFYRHFGYSSADRKIAEQDLKLALEELAQWDESNISRKALSILNRKESYFRSKQLNDYWETLRAEEEQESHIRSLTTTVRKKQEIVGEYDVAFIGSLLGTRELDQTEATERPQKEKSAEEIFIESNVQDTSNPFRVSPDFADEALSVEAAEEAVEIIRKRRAPQDEMDDAQDHDGKDKKDHENGEKELLLINLLDTSYIVDGVDIAAKVKEQKSLQNYEAAFYDILDLSEEGKWHHQG